MNKIPALVFFCAFLISTSLYAQDKPQEKENNFAAKNFAFEYSPEFCDFTAAFPEKPLITEQCEDENDPATCFNLVSYTKVFGLSSTVKIDVICNPSNDEMFAYFTHDKMESTVRAMTKEKVIKELNVDSRQEEEYRQSGIVAQSRQGLNDTIYIAQLWIAKNSIMSVEAELMGEQSAEADQLFANMLRNIGYTKNIKGKEYGQKKATAWKDKKKQLLEQQKQSEKNPEKKEAEPKQSKP